MGLVAAGCVEEGDTIIVVPQRGRVGGGGGGAILAIDLNGQQAGNDFTRTFQEAGGPVTIASGTAEAGSPQLDTLTSLTVTITNLQNAPAEVLAADTTGTAISASYDPATGVLQLTGEDTWESYTAVLRTITYDNTSLAPAAGARTLSVVATEAQTTGPTSTSTIDVVPTAAPLDPTFGADGVATEPAGNSGLASQLQPDGKIVTMAGSDFPFFQLSRFLADGTPDPTFPSVTSVFNLTPFDMLLQTDGRIVVVGTNPHIRLERRTSTGAVDGTFGVGGLADVTVGTGSGANAVQQQVDGRLVVAGYGLLGGVSELSVARLNTDGSLHAALGVLLNRSPRPRPARSARLGTCRGGGRRLDPSPCPAGPDAGGP